MSIKEKIEKASSIDEMNDLRLEIVKASNREILLIWQKKYAEMKRCPTCGKGR